MARAAGQGRGQSPARDVTASQSGVLRRFVVTEAGIIVQVGLRQSRRPHYAQIFVTKCRAGCLLKLFVFMKCASSSRQRFPWVSEELSRPLNYCILFVLRQDGGGLYPPSHHGDNINHRFYWPLIALGNHKGCRKLPEIRYQ